MYALVDANSFYASAEKVFDPAIRDKPVVVLTNNDGCICALCDRAKQLGVGKFGPYYKAKAVLARNGAVIRSSNYELYDDLSNKMMKVIGQFAPDQHVYSIDESFLHFESWQPDEGWAAYANRIKQAVWQQLRLPVGVGIGPTPTLAKAASYAGKRLGAQDGIAILDTQPAIASALQQMSTTDVWGVGKRIAARLEKMGIHTAWQLACACPKNLRAEFSIDIARTVTELNGTPCIKWDTHRANKQQVYSTRAFGRPVTDRQDIAQALAWHAEKVAEKLRVQQSGVKTLTLFAHANPFASSGHYHKAIQHQFDAPTSDLRALVQVASRAADTLFKAGVVFHKCGVGAIELIDDAERQPELFVTNAYNPKLMQCLDKINGKYGRQTIGTGAKGTHQNWAMKREFLSPQYTTNWRHLPKINCDMG
ncbi:Y-family DNA polymerase [Alteromonas halophila]|uniref:DNA polymerase V subunit UmuC n=1 Tax=Alteromonas halophila TaxID=516698 RepID=A0A918JGL6_9ALTE|nr:Y-family DNA polymerase [Alteromonas halophila]GGW78253.1 DNA polymerase V subunit UmuC [Alteromonas halophila]